MIYVNGKEDKTWMESLGRAFKLKKSVRFFLTSHYQGTQIVNDRPITTYPESFALPCLYIGIKEGAAVEVRYAIKQIAVRGKKNEGNSLDFSPGELVFRNGVLEVRKDQLDLYWFLINHPRCETNPAYFDKAGKVKDDAITVAMNTYSHFLFKERDEAKENEISFDAQKAVIDAQNFVVNKMSEKEARELYRLYNEPDWEEASIARIKNFLLVKAAEDPKKFTEEIDSEIRTYKAKVNEASAAEVIFFDGRKRVWKFSGIENANNVIMAVAKGANETIALAKYLQLKDNGELWETLCAKVLEAEQLATQD